MAGIFTNIDNQVATIKASLNDALVGDRVSALIDILVVSITLYVVYKAYLIWAGKVQEPMKDIIWDFASKAIIIAFITNADGWLTLSINAVNALHDWAGGGVVLFSNLDEIANNTTIALDPYLIMRNTEPAYPFIITAKWIGVGLGLAIPFFTMMLAKIALQLLIATAPFFIFCKLFGFMKGMFAGWLRLVFTNIFIVLFVTLLFGSSISFMEWLLGVLEDAPANGGLIAFYIVIGGAFQAAIARLAVSIAKGIASIDIESLKTGSPSNVNNNTSFGSSYNSSSTLFFANRANAAAMMARNFLYKAGSTLEVTSKNITQHTSKAFRQYKNNLFKNG